MAHKDLKVAAESLRSTLDPNILSFETTDEIQPSDHMIGQPRALQALEFGLRVESDGYNVYVSGTPGTGRMKAVNQYLSKLAPQRPRPPDLCYVYNFDDSDCPRALSLEPGWGHELAQDMAHFVENLGDQLPRTFQGEEFLARKSEVVKNVEAQREQVWKQAQEEAAEAGFTVQATPMGIATIPLKEGHQMTQEEFEALPPEEKQEIEERGNKLKDRIEATARVGQSLEQEARKVLEQLERETVLQVVAPLIAELQQKYGHFTEVVDYLERVRNNIPEHAADFLPKEADSKAQGLEAILREDHLYQYKVNVIVDNRHTEGAPVVIEYRPTYYNLFGRVDYRARLGGMVTDFTMIKAGSIHQANGGYLVVQAKDLLTSLLAWETLKRTLRSAEASIENLGEQYSAIPTATLRPQPTPISVKVVMVGPPALYHLLYSLDEDFRRLFGVKADFDVEMDRSLDHVEDYASYVSSVCHAHGLKPLDRGAVARVIDYGSRMVEDQTKLSTRLADVEKLIIEASFWAAQNGNGHVTAQDVDRAVREKKYRSDLIEEKVRDLVLEGTIHIATAGETAGMVNGLAVNSLGDYVFGRPTRITARTHLGAGGVANIERETEMSGRIHSKGFLILNGYLKGKYGQDKPMAVGGSITFEQTYDEIDGDSASSTELYALLSSLSGLPLKQGIAVTGSVNQEGDVQAVGGVTHKIEGFFDVCKARGLSGDQGVIIPRDNVKNLMLKDEVVEAVREGLFNIWAVSSIDEGIELLTGAAAGEKQADGAYPRGSVHYLVDRRLQDFARQLKSYGAELLAAERTQMPDGKEHKKAA